MQKSFFRGIALPVALLLVFVAGMVVAQGGDWRRSAPANQKIENLVEVMPGAADVMIVMGERYNQLYHAGRKGEWEYAEYQMEEIQALAKKLMITRPGRAATTQEFLDSGFLLLSEAIESEDRRAFNGGFEAMRAACISCHYKNDHGFIGLTARPKLSGSPVLQ